MSTSTLITLILFFASLFFGLIQWIVTNLFVKKMDELNQSFKELSNKLEHYVKVQDHKDDYIRLDRRIEKIEDKLFNKVD